MRQAEGDCGDMDVPVVLMREDNYPSWLVVLRIEDTEKFLNIIANNKETSDGRTDDIIRGGQEAE